MHFFSNKIVNPVGSKSATFDDWVQKILKSAGSETTQETKVAETEPAATEVQTPSKSVKAECGKEMGESSDAGKVTEKHTPAGPGNDENPDPKILINNDPNYQKPKKDEESNKAKPKSEKKDKEASSKSGLVSKFQKISSLDRAGKLELFKVLSANRNNPIEYVEAMTGLKFANMTPEEKKGFVDFWEIIYPADYVKEMIADR